MTDTYPLNVEIDEAKIAKLTNTYKAAYKDIYDSIAKSTEFSASRRRAILAQIDGILEDLGKKTQKQLELDFTELYKTGSNDAIRQLQNIGADIPAKSGFSIIHKDAISALVDDTARSFGDAITGVSRSARRLLNQTAKEYITQEIATSRIAGEALRKAKQRIVGVLETEGLSALVDKGGNNWSLDRYAEMLYRTKAVEARNTGLVNRMAENGYDLVQVSYHGADCQLCKPWEGKVLSSRGETAGYPTLAEAERAGLFHPNCRHAINTMIPSLARLTKGYDLDAETLNIPQKELDRMSKLAGKRAIKQSKPEAPTITTESGIKLFKPSNPDDLIRMNEGVRYNAAFQLDGAAKFGQKIPEGVVEAVNKIDVSKAVDPVDAAEIIIRELPTHLKSQPIVEETVKLWGKQLQQAFNAKGLGARATAGKDAITVFRATGNSLGKGEAVLGQGKYFAFDKSNVAKYGDKLEQYILSPEAKLLDLSDAQKLSRFTDDAISSNRELHIKLLEESPDKALAEVMKKHAQSLGYDGIKADDKTFGAVVFDDKFLIKKK